MVEISKIYNYYYYYEHYDRPAASEQTENKLLQRHYSNIFSTIKNVCFCISRTLELSVCMIMNSFIQQIMFYKIKEQTKLEFATA